MSELHSVRSCHWLRLVLLLVGASLVVAQHDERTLAYRDGFWSGRVYVAAFGDPMEHSRSFRLLRPPPGQDLCQTLDLDGINNHNYNAINTINTTEFISTSNNNTTANTILATAPPSFSDYEDFIGLLIPRGKGDCSEEVQTLVALQIQERIPALRYLIVHGTDQRVGSTPVTLNLYDSADSSSTDGDRRSYRSIGVVYMPYSEYIQLDDIMIEQSLEQSPASPYFLDPGSADWEFMVSTNGKIRVTTDTDYTLEEYIFYWLRMTLFIVLIITPCMRAGYLWYAGGGRLHWRRNDNGRIIGILYVPPMPIWMWLRRNPNQGGNDLSAKLNEEQFQALPIIKYQRNKKYREDPSESAGEGHELDLEQPIGSSIPLDCNDSDDDDNDKLKRPSRDESKIFDLEMQQTQDTDDMILVPSVDSLGSDHNMEETPQNSPTSIPFVNTNGDDAQSNELATTCTMCSICIDDFEAGEELVLLPRCKHSFHKECIRPWLLERQGCCPLCKVPVLFDANDGSSADDTTDSVEEVVVEQNPQHGPTTVSVQNDEPPVSANGPTTTDSEQNDKTRVLANGPTTDSTQHDRTPDDAVEASASSKPIESSLPIPTTKPVEDEEEPTQPRPGEEDLEEPTQNQR